jgi:hypothetical protein
LVFLPIYLLSEVRVAQTQPSGFPIIAHVIFCGHPQQLLAVRVARTESMQRREGLFEQFCSSASSKTPANARKSKQAIDILATFTAECHK